MWKGIKLISIHHSFDQFFTVENINNTLVRTGNGLHLTESQTIKRPHVWAMWIKFDCKNITDYNA